MSRSLAIVVGPVLFAVGAIGMAVWVWVKRRQLALAAAKASTGTGICGSGEAGIGGSYGGRGTATAVGREIRIL